MSQELKDKLTIYEDFFKYGYLSPFSFSFSLKHFGMLSVIIKIKHGVTLDKEEYDLYLKKYSRYIKNIEYDISRSKLISNEVIFGSTQKNLIIYSDHDKNEYHTITKKERYLDISPFQILKILYKKHKISKREYKESIKRMNDKKPIKSKIKSFIESYYRQIRANTVKTNMLSIQNKEHNSRHNTQRIKINNQLYQVTLKKNIKRFSDKLLHSEFKQRLNQCNKLFFESDIHNSSK